MDPDSNPEQNLDQKMAALGRSLGEREAAHAEPLVEARNRADRLHARIETAIGRFVAAAESAGSPNLGIELSPPRLDDKHIRAVEFELRRGRHGAIVTVKSKGEVTLVGPFRIGKEEGPCRSFPFEAEMDLDAALGEFLGRFLEEAMTP